MHELKEAGPKSNSSTMVSSGVGIVGVSVSVSAAGASQYSSQHIQHTRSLHHGQVKHVITVRARQASHSTVVNSMLTMWLVMSCTYMYRCHQVTILQ